MTKSEHNAVRGLLRIFRRNGYVRLQDPRRYDAEGYWQYKKGDEIRLVANSKEELAVIRKWLTQAGFNSARPFAKGTQFRQPIYGREFVRRFLEMLKQEQSAIGIGSPRAGTPSTDRTDRVISGSAVIRKE